MALLKTNQHQSCKIKNINLSRCLDSQENDGHINFLRVLLNWNRAGKHEYSKLLKFRWVECGNINVYTSE